MTDKLKIILILITIIQKKEPRKVAGERIYIIYIDNIM